MATFATTAEEYRVIPDGCTDLIFQVTTSRIKAIVVGPMGFADEPHLVHEFKRLYGATPGLVGTQIYLDDLYNTHGLGHAILSKVISYGGQQTCKEFM